MRPVQLVVQEGVAVEALEAQGGEAEREGRLIRIFTGTTIGTFSLVLSEDQRQFLIVSGAASALEYLDLREDEAEGLAEGDWVGLSWSAAAASVWAGESRGSED